jgi:hypothetical protein
LTDISRGRGWREIYSEQLYDLDPSRIIIRVIKSKRMRRLGYVARIGKRKGAYRVVLVKPAEKSKLGRLKRRWEAVNEMDLQEVIWGIVD